MSSASQVSVANTEAIGVALTLSRVFYFAKFLALAPCRMGTL